MKGVRLGIFCLLFYSLTLQCHSFERFAGSNRSDESRELTTIIEHCEEEYFYKQLSIVRGDEDLSLEFFRKIHEEFLIPVRVWDGLGNLNSIGFQSCVVICISTEEMRSFFETVDSYSWIANNVYVIHNPDRTPIEDSERISIEKVWSSSAAELWKKSSVHRLILSINGRNLFFDPFERSTISRGTKSSDFNKTANPERLFEYGAPKKLENPRLLKRRDTFGGYEADVAMFPYITAKRDENGTWSGLEANAMYEICKRMDIKPRVFSPVEEFGWSANGKFFGTLGRLVYHESKLAFNGFFVKNYGSENLEFTTFLGSDKICVVVPKRAKLPEYLLIVKIFSLQSWVLIFFGNSLVALSHAMMKSIGFELRVRKGKPKKSFRNLPPQGKPRSCRSLTRVQRLLGTWIFLSFYSSKTTTEWIGERLHVACGLMLGIVIGGCFTSQLASSFSKPAFLQNIETLEELDDSGLEILTSFPNLLYDVFTYTDSSTRSNLQMKLKLKKAPEIETQVLEKRNAGYLDRKDALTLAENVNKKIHVVSEYPREYQLAYPIPKGSPFLHRVNSIIGRLQSAGLYAKWFKDMARPIECGESPQPVVIRLSHLLIPFFILLTGLGIAGGIFLSELKG